VEKWNASKKKKKNSNTNWATLKTEKNQGAKKLEKTLH
jgi:hypothetical protein